MDEFKYDVKVNLYLLIGNVVEIMDVVSLILIFIMDFSIYYLPEYSI